MNEYSSHGGSPQVSRSSSRVQKKSPHPGHSFRTNPSSSKYASRYSASSVLMISRQATVRLKQFRPRARRASRDVFDRVDSWSMHGSGVCSGYFDSMTHQHKV